MRRTNRPRGGPEQGGPTRDRRESRTLGQRLRRPAFLGVLIGAALLSSGASPSGIGLPMISADAPGEQDLTGLVLLILLLFGTFTAVLHLIGRRNWTRREKALTAELAQTHARLDRANLFLSTEPQVVVAWARGRRAGHRGRLFAGHRHAFAAPGPRFWLLARPRPRAEDGPRGRAASRSRRRVLGRAREHPRPAFRDRRARRRRTRGHAHPRRFGRPSATGAASREPYRTSRRTRRDPRDARRHPPSRLDARRRRAAGLVECRLCARRRGAGFGGRGGARARTVRRRGARGGAGGARTKRGVWRQRAPAVAAGERKTLRSRRCRQPERLGRHGQRPFRTDRAARRDCSGS